MPIGRHQLLSGVFWSLATTTAGTTAAVAVKILSTGMSAWFIVWVQYGLCTLLTLPWLLRYGRGALRSRRYRLHLVRAAGGWLGFTAYYLAIPLIPLVEASLLRAAAPLWVPLIVMFMFGERVPSIRWIALLTGFIGVCLVLRPDAGSVSSGHLLGVLAGLALAVSMAGTRALSASEPASRVLFFYFGLSFLASTPMGLLHAMPVTLSQIALLAMVGLAIFLTMIFYTRAYSRAPTSVVAPLGYLAVPLVAALDWLLWGHMPGVWTLAGSLVVILSGVMAVTLGRRDGSEH